jgi:diguanylate cyclase (GGDEF)-like protein/PAS domain S-box-containing protein
MYAMQASQPEPGWHPGGSGHLRELLLAGLVDRLPAAIYAAEPGAQGQWFYASPRIAEILGFGAEDLIADPGLWARQLHPADRDRVLNSELTRGVNGRYQLEYRMVRSDGQVVWVLDDAVQDETGKPGCVQHGLLYDITARKRTELLLAEHADIVERVARGDELESILVELASATEVVSGTARCVIEVAASSAGLGRSILCCSTGALSLSEHAELGPAGHEADFTAPSGTKLGRVCLHYRDPAMVRTQDADLAGWAASLASVAVLRAAEHARVTMSMSLLEATLDATADGILVMDLGGRILGYNQKFLDMWRIEPTVLASEHDTELRASVLHQLVNPEEFTRRADRLMASPDECSHDEIEFLDGRFFERYSQPQRIEGESVGRVWSFRDMTLHRQLEQELRAQAFTDPLTPLANRTYFIQEVTAALGASRRREGSIAVLLLDLDDFKTVNDSLGHVAGDALLIEVSKRLQGCVVAGDIAARLGGDEFVVLLQQLDGPEDADDAAERVLAAVSGPMMVEGQLLTIRASIGIAAPSADEDAGDLLRNADLAMYTAKRDGGGRCHRYAPAMHAEVVSRLALKADLERAIESDELIVHYQPVLDLRSFQIVSMEALVRWQHPERGLISPEEFVALAEESRLIDRLGSVVLHKACNQLAQWRRSIPAHRNLSISVNVSPRQLSDRSLIEEIQRVLWAAGLPASALILEITESSLATPTVDVVTVLNQLRDLGVALALDDFGVGYSSLGQLINFPLDLVKVDKSFVERLNGDPSGAALLRAVLQVAEALSLETTIEGIENEQQLSQVRALGCGRAQGFLLSRPLEAEAASDLLAGRSSPVRAVAGSHSIMEG